MPPNTTPDDQSTFGHADIKHPFAAYRLSDAVQLANAITKLQNCNPVASLAEAREVTELSASACNHTWLTGASALDVLDAAIDERDLAKSCRIL